MGSDARSQEQAKSYPSGSAGQLHLRDRPHIEPSVKHVSSCVRRLVSFGGSYSCKAKSHSHDSSNHGQDLGSPKSVGDATPSAGKFQCHRCWKSFGRRQDLVRHIEEQAESVSKWRCPDCQTEYNRKSRFEDHHRQKHACTLGKCGHATAAEIPLAHRAVVGCGFCGVFFQPLLKQEDVTKLAGHLVQHYKEGKTHQAWDPTLQLWSLLSQPHVQSIWHQVCMARFHTLDRVPTLAWSSDTAGYSINRLECGIPATDLYSYLCSLLQAGLPTALAYEALGHPAVGPMLRLPPDIGYAPAGRHFDAILSGFGVRDVDNSGSHASDAGEVASTPYLDSDTTTLATRAHSIASLDPALLRAKSTASSNNPWYDAAKVGSSKRLASCLFADQHQSPHLGIQQPDPGFSQEAFLFPQSLYNPMCAGQRYRIPTIKSRHGGGGDWHLGQHSVGMPGDNIILEAQPFSMNATPPLPHESSWKRRSLQSARFWKSEGY